MFTIPTTSTYLFTMTIGTSLTLDAYEVHMAREFKLVGTVEIMPKLGL